MKKLKLKKSVVRQLLVSDLRTIAAGASVKTCYETECCQVSA